MVLIVPYECAVSVNRFFPTMSMSENHFASCLLRVSRYSLSQFQYLQIFLIYKVLIAHNFNLFYFIDSAIGWTCYVNDVALC